MFSNHSYILQTTTHVGLTWFHILHSINLNQTFMLIFSITKLLKFFSRRIDRIRRNKVNFPINIKKLMLNNLYPILKLQIFPLLLINRHLFLYRLGTTYSHQLHNKVINNNYLIVIIIFSIEWIIFIIRGETEGYKIKLEILLLGCGLLNGLLGLLIRLPIIRLGRLNLRCRVITLWESIWQVSVDSH